MFEPFPIPPGEPGASCDETLLRHLFFNPLAVVRGSAETLLARDLDPLRRDELLRAIVASSARIERIVLELVAAVNAVPASGVGRARPSEVPEPADDPLPRSSVVSLDSRRA